MAELTKQTITVEHVTLVRRMLSATRKRHAHALANQIATAVQNAMGDSVQNEKSDGSKSA
jgi:hypothetical protein